MRPESEHLSETEIERLLAGEAGNEDAMRHTAICGACRALLELHQQAADQLRQLRPETAPAPGPECPPATEWPQVAAAMMDAASEEARLDHAAGCDACGDLLRQATEALNPEPTAEEREALAALRTSGGEWRRAFAEDAARASQARRGRWRTFGALAAAIVITIAVAGRWGAKHMFGGEEREVKRLLAQAYRDDRRVEMRIAGADYGPMRTARGGEQGSALDRSPALLEAEARIARAMRSGSAEANWLEIQGRADLIDGRRYDAAIAELQRALAERPGDDSVKTDLATAYFERAQALNRPADAARAVDLLGAVLHDNPRDTVALFNRAIALENVLLLHQAEADWKRYLELDGSSDWAAEARRRLAAVEQKLNQEKSRVGQALESPEAFAAAVAGSEADGVDRRLADYWDEASGAWLLAAFGPGQEHGAAQGARQGLAALAGLAAERHRDTYWKDLLAGSSKAGFAGAAVEMAQGAIAARAGSYDTARKLAHEAGLQFHALGNRAGELEAGGQELYATRLAARTEDCDAMARPLAGRIPVEYPRLRARAFLDAGFCAKMVNDKGAAEADGRESERTAERAGFQDMRLAAIKFSADLALADGEGSAVFGRAEQVLASFWNDGAPELLGYNVCTTLVGAGEYEEMWRFAAEAAREALVLFPAGRDPVWKAAVQELLARDLMLSGESNQARGELLAAQGLLASLPAGKTSRFRAAEVDEWLGQAELTAGRPALALEWLEKAGESLKESPRAQLSVDYYGAVGRARMEIGDRAGARAALDEALNLLERGLKTSASEPERLAWSRRGDQVWRDRVRWELDEDPARAWALWEWYRGASLHQGAAGVPADGAAIRERAVPGGGALLSYAVFSDGIAAWVASGRGVGYRWIKIREDVVQGMAAAFAARCADPASTAAEVREDGRALERLLFDPVAPLLAGTSRLSIEPDEALDRAPFEAMIDGEGRYLGDRYELSYSPGAYYLAASRAEERFSATSRVLVAADASGHPEAGLGALPEAETEARQVAGLFPNSTLLLDAETNRNSLEQGVRDAVLVHFAGHAVNRPDSSVLLVGSEPVDATLFRQLHFPRARVVVLAACGSTEEGAGAALDGQDGLARELLAEGVPQVAASRWAINSEATRELIAAFYGSLRAGSDAAAAMRAAREKLRSDARWAHPYYWAALAIFGRA